MSIAGPVGALQISNANLTANVAEVVTSINRRMQTEAVGELEVVVADATFSMMNGLGGDGDNVMFGGGWYQVADRELSAANGLVTMRARSAVARGLRAKYKASREQKVTAKKWIAKRVKAHGGRIVAQPSAAKGVISQGSHESELDVIGSLCSDRDWVWAEYGGVFYVGTGMWWWEAERIVDWRVTWKRDPGSDALDITGGFTADDTSMRGQISITLPYEQGIRMAPLHRIQLAGCGSLDGWWLISAVDSPIDGYSPTTVTAYLPRKPRPAKAKKSKKRRK